MEDWKNELKATLEKALQKKAELMLRHTCANLPIST